MDFWLFLAPLEAPQNIGAMLTALPLLPLWDVAMAGHGLRSLLPLCREVRRSLLHCLETREEMQLEDFQCHFDFAEVLASKALKLRRLFIGRKEFDLESLVESVCICLPDLTAPEALMLAPLLRHRSEKIERINFGRGVHLELKSLKSLKSLPAVGSRVFCSDDVDLLFLAGYLPTRPSVPSASFLCRLLGPWRGPRVVASEATLEVAIPRYQNLETVPRVAKAINVARRRSGVRLQLCDPWQDKACERHEFLRSAFCVFLVIFMIFAMLLLRICEDAFAKSQGYPGALMATHPLKALSFRERITALQLE